jgi:predicted nucleotidyltransferase
LHLLIWFVENRFAVLNYNGLIEGDYIETIDGLFFAVKGFRHPGDRVIAYLRYVPDPLGDRKLKNIKYRRVYDLEDTKNYLMRDYPVYLSWVDYISQNLQTVPHIRIKRIYKPREGVKKIYRNKETKLDYLTYQFISTLLNQSKVPKESIGVSGSLLIGLTTEDSDIDLIVYGEENGRKIYDGLTKMRRDFNMTFPLDIKNATKISISRWGKINIKNEKFIKNEIEKKLHGLFNEKEYFIRLINVPQVEEMAKPLKLVMGKATIKEDKDSIFTPCTYKIEDIECSGKTDLPNITELWSLRGKFTEQAKKGDVVEFEGTIEEVVVNKEKKYRVAMISDHDYLIPIRYLADTF